jgi:hypothetical protein
MTVALGIYPSRWMLQKEYPYGMHCFRTEEAGVGKGGLDLQRGVGTGALVRL